MVVIKAQQLSKEIRFDDDLVHTADFEEEEATALTGLQVAQRLALSMARLPDRRQEEEPSL